MNLKLQNYQKHKKLEIEFSDFTCIIGQSDTGKTAIFRAINDLLWSKTKNIDRIRHGSDACSITLEYKGVTVKKTMSRTKPNEFTVNGEVLKKSATKSGSEFFAEKGIIFEELNYQDQSRGHFFISENPTTAGNMISKYANLEEVRLYTDDIKKELGYANRELSKLEKEHNELEKKLTQDVINDYDSFKNHHIEINKLDDNFTIIQEKYQATVLIRKLVDSINTISLYLDKQTEYNRLGQLFDKYQMVLDYHYISVLSSDITNRLFLSTKELQIEGINNYKTLCEQLNLIDISTLKMSEYNQFVLVDNKRSKTLEIINAFKELNNINSEYNHLVSTTPICPECGQIIKIGNK